MNIVSEKTSHNRAVLASRAIPIAGWIYLGYGLVRPLTHTVARGVWWIDAVLSVGAHTAQILPAMNKLRPLGYSRSKIAAMTLIFGATWWKTISPTLPSESMVTSR